MNASAVLVSFALLAPFAVGGCTEPEDPGPVDTDVAYSIKCATCDDNGLPRPAWDLRARLYPAALTAVGLRFADGTIRPLCAPPTTGVPGAITCTLDSAWAAWAATDPANGTLAREIIRVAAGHGDTVSSSLVGVGSTGAFGLAPTALTVPWDERVQSLITAGLTLIVDPDANTKSLCMKTEFTPDCPPSYNRQELLAAGNLFAGRDAMVVGGSAVDSPDRAVRVCPPGFGIGCTSYGSTTAYGAHACNYTGAPDRRYPTSCTDPAGGAAFDFPVQAFVDFDPRIPGTLPYTGRIW